MSTSLPAAPTRIPTHTIETALPAARPMLTELAERSRGLGRLLNVHAQMSHAPVVLAAYMAMRRALEEHSVLDLKTRSAIALTVATVHGSAYGQYLNAFLATRACWSANELLGIAAGYLDANAKMTALLTLVREAAAYVGHIDDSTWQAALEAGWTDTELTESFATIGLVQFVDGFTNFAHTELDIPGHLPPR